MRSFAVLLLLSLVVTPFGCRAGTVGPDVAGALDLDTDGGRGAPDAGSTPADPGEGGVPGDIDPTDGSFAPDSGATEAGRPFMRDSGADGHSSVAADGGGNAGDASAADSTPAGPPGIFQVFSQIPQFGIYATADPKGYSPPPGVLMWEHGTAFAAKLTEAQQARIGEDLAARITYHAQCDNYDRVGGLFFIVMPHGQLPTADAPRTELTRFITPFSDYRRGSLATYVFPDADISPYARALADRTNDVWIGVFGGSNPYDGDPCTNAGLPPEFRAVGFKYSVDFISTRPLPSATASCQTACFYESVKKIPFTSTFMNPGGEVSGRVTVIVSGHGANAGGVEYRNTQDTVAVNGKQVGAFSTRIDCASYEKFSPDGNPGIFRNNNSGNPRNWCPGALVPSHSFDATLKPGSNTVTLGISPSDVPSGSSYSTSLNFTER